jgi:hypothetical protein
MINLRRIKIHASLRHHQILGRTRTINSISNKFLSMHRKSTQMRPYLDLDLDPLNQKA